MTLDRSGSGDPLVLLHGVGSRRGVFSPVAELLAAHHDVVALDLPGFGTTPPAAGVDGSIASYATWVEGVLAELGISSPHVVGNSMGGGIALELGRRGVARSVVAFSPIGFWGRPGLVWVATAVRGMRAASRVLRPVLPALLEPAPLRTALFGLFYGHPARLEVDRCLADVDALLGAAGVDAALAGFGAWRATPPDRLRQIPVTVAWGSRDRLLPSRTQSARARQELPWARHVRLAGCGHLPFADDPAACLQTVLDTTRFQTVTAP